MIRRWRRLALWGAAWSLVFVLGVVAFKTDRRVQADATFCTMSCHHEVSPGIDQNHANGHDGVPCQGCHTTTLGSGLRLLWQSYTSKSAPQKHGGVTGAACQSCHEKDPADWRPIAATQGHREHQGAKNVDCLSCHADGTHKEALPEKACTKCHESQTLHKATTLGAETCLSCHVYTASQKNARPPTTVTCERCHASPEALAASAGAGDANGEAAPQLRDVNAGALHGGVACQLCHNAHGKKPTPPPGQPVCATCHKFENFQAGTDTKAPVEAHMKCEGCHKPHQNVGSATLRCIDCHEKNATGLTAAGTGTSTALKHKSCASCHLPHTWRAERSGCMTCHEDKAQMVLARSPPSHQQCTNCHDIHGPPPSGAVCLNCHADTKGQHVALAPEKHKDCTSCHNPHAPRPADTRSSCANCHTQEVTEVARDGPEPHAQDSCFTCHQPHNNPLPGPNVCARCHDERALVVAAAAPPKHRVCTSCHKRHVFRVTDIKSTCASCHGPMFDSAATGFAKIPHQGDCRQCHTIHGSPEVEPPTCLGCHKDVAGEFHPPNAKHADCNSCHRPHTPASTAPAQCRTCHADKAAVAAQWPAESAHAQECNRCHQQHDVRNKKACGECHGNEAASAVGSRHQCTQCHAPHTAPPGTGPAWWTRCATCHADKAASVKLRGPTHSSCQNCHKQHRFAVPTCTSCHADMPQKALHSVPQHNANCQSCHDPHVASQPTPAQCLACHTNRRNHEPNAQRCQACHMFK
jgi:hypothetical protein